MPITNFVWDDLSDNVLMETDEDNVPVVKYTNEPNHFGEVLSQHRHGQDQYFHFDGLGSTRNLTDQNQAVSDSYSYTAFGETVASSGSTPNPFQFNGAYGYYSSGETGDLYVRRRTYAPSIARWLSRDSLGFVDGPNVYAYAGNPVPGSRDPTGKSLLIRFLPDESAIFPNDCTKLQEVSHGINTDIAFQPNCWWIQRVEILCLRSSCTDKCLPRCGEPTLTGSVSFFEAWPVAEVGGMLLSTVHEFGLRAIENSCEAKLYTATIAVYCGAEVDQYIRNNFKEQKPGNETPLKLPEACGDNTVTEVGDWVGGEPPFWNDAPQDGKATYGVLMGFICCPEVPSEVLTIPSHGPL